MKIQKFSELLQSIEKTPSRNDMTQLLAERFIDFTPEEIMVAMYLIQGRLAPKFTDLEFNFSRKLIFKAFEAIEDKSKIKQIYADKGDVGLVAKELLLQFSGDSHKHEDKKLDILTVYEQLSKIASFEGKGSQEKKSESYLNLMFMLDPLSIQYMSRVIVGDLRLGLSDKTLLDAFSWFISGDKSIREQFDAAFGAKADIGSLAAIMLENKDNILEMLEKIKIEPLTPVASKLVEREKSASKVWERMPECYVQPKLDGLRGQLHKNGSVTKIFSRNMEDMTNQFPELNASLAALPYEKIILDSEIIGFDRETEEYLSYQETMQRKRKYGIEESADAIPVKAMCFDVLYFKDQDISKLPIEDRIQVLEEVCEASDLHLEMLETIKTQSEEELSEYFENTVLEGLEGVITKASGTSYDPGTRNFDWIKLKANSKSSMVDTIDVVVMGYFIGRGQRAKHGIGALLTGVYNEKNDTFESVGKVGSGIPDELFPVIQKRIQEITVKEKPENFVVSNAVKPDFWVLPEVVIELDADEITRSPSHMAGVGFSTNVPKDDPKRGLSIRFPRLKVWDRDKVLPNTVEELVRMYTLRKEKK